MKCVICRHGMTKAGTATVTLERGSFTMVVKGVPAEVCDNCGEAYVDGRISSELLESAERMIAAGGQVEVRQYVEA